MSYHLVSEVIDQYRGPPVAKLVLIVLARFANKDGICWPSVATIAGRARIDATTVRRQYPALEREGWLRQVTPRRGGRALTTRWQVVIPINAAGLGHRNRRAQRPPINDIKRGRSARLLAAVKAGTAPIKGGH